MSDENNNFASNLPVLAADAPTPAAAALAETAKRNVEIAILTAKRFPREEATCYARAIRCFERPGIAEEAVYNFPRGGSSVEGPSVACAREVARCWGNLDYGATITSEDDTWVHMTGYAVDLETNYRVSYPDAFPKKVQRKNRATGTTEWIDCKDERELRELKNRRGAILIRNALLSVLPKDVVNDCVAKAKETIKAKAGGDLKRSRDEVIRALSVAFDEIGVAPELVEKYLGHKLSAITEDEVVTLKGIFKSLRDGHSKREEYFDIKAESREKAAELNAKLGVKKAGGDQGKLS